AKEILYNPHLTQWEDSYDGRNKEPKVFPAKLPVILLQGTEGIAVGMSTKILPHNTLEVLDALKAELQGKPFELVPDFPTGGILDASEYKDGLGKVTIQAKISEKKNRLIIEEIPYGTTTESLIESIENAAKSGKIKIRGINDFTTDQVNIEIVPGIGVDNKVLMESLYAFTDCQVSISVNLLLIKEELPVIMTVTEVIQHHAKQLLGVLKGELEHELSELMNELHRRTLERIFIEEKIYRRIEKEKSREGMYKTVYTGFEPFAKELIRPIEDEDVKHLLGIPIRRISLYDIEKARKEIEAINDRIKEIKKHLKNLTAYALAFLDGVYKKLTAPKEEKRFVRKTEISSLEKADVRAVARRDLKLMYDNSTGYLGYGVKSESAKELFEVSEYDRILIVKNDGSYYVCDVPEIEHVDKNMALCCIADKDILAEHVITLLYRQEDTGYIYIKKAQILKFILNKEYELLPESCKALRAFAHPEVKITLTYKPSPGLRKKEDEFLSSDYLVKGVNAKGVRLSTKPVASMKVGVLKKKK
ncbi:DNA topoisomerase IV, partial [candidate division KSB3 bacterium]